MELSLWCIRQILIVMRKLLKISGFGNTTLILVQCSNHLSCKASNVRLSKTCEDFYILASLIILQSNLNYPDLDYLCFFLFSGVTSMVPSI